jgi:(1->4)-alpha-D-glucan 1-alpha-D-glucosylmutase
MLPTRVPSSTYRVQLNKNFRFADVCTILDYLHELGISDLYLSPILMSRKGSDHGYDVTDPTRINPDLGNEEEFATLQTELQNRGMGLLLDIVPNHMAASVENPWWMDVLENGTQSAFAAFFDIEWHPHARSLDGKILLPVLGRPFGEALESAEIKLVFQEGKLFFHYFDALFPLAPRSYHAILDHRSAVLKETIGEDAPVYHEYSGILASLLELERADRRSGESAADRRLRYEAARDRLSSLMKTSAEVIAFLEENLREINGTAGDAGSFGFLQRLLAEQNYKLSFWQNLNESINYRRFFTIADLVGVRVEDPHVFEATHGYVLRLVAKSPLAGLRVDHIDGLRDPLAYLNKLQERLNSSENRSEGSSYILVEKILARQESLPGDWPVSGTTGYDYLNEANGVFVDPDGSERLEEIYSTFIGRHQDFADVVYQKKKLVMNTLLGVEMRTLGRLLAELALQDRYAREFNREQLIDALIEVTACLSVYRTYIRNMELPVQARENIEQAVASARSRAAHLSSACFDFVREVLLLLNPPHVLADQREARLAFVMRWQQFTGPIVAKGLEDTSLYVYHPLLSLNEVGGDPRPTEAASQEQFYSFLADRLQTWPGSLDASSTHDTKRSEDVRARINVLSEMPDDWRDHLELWSEQNKKHKEEINGQAVPDRNEEYFLYQTLLGVWPLDLKARETLLERVQAHLIKATREAMVHTRWTRPNQRHEEALQRFVASILSSEHSAEFLEDFRQFQKKVAYFGMVNGLSQTLLKVASPGVADFYQGSELWDLRLVDPDNRGPVNFAQRAAALDSVAKVAASDSGSKLGDLFEHWHDGRIKLYLIWKAIRFRRDHADLFREGELLPLQSAGCHSRNVIAFLRKRGRECVLVAVPRWLSFRPELSPEGTMANLDWCDTRIILPPESPSEWNNILVRETVSSKAAQECGLKVNDLFARFPVALFHAKTA